MPESEKDIARRLRPALEERLDDYRLAHSISVAEYARTLARIYGCDPDAAYLAGLLHDWDKCLPPDEIIGHARRYGIFIPDDRDAAVSVLHAQTGAADLANRYPEIPAEVISAISKHTLGSTEMSDLDKVIYIADMLEPLRTKRAIEDLRYNVGSASLDELFSMCYTCSLRILIDKRRYIYPGALDVWNSLIEKERLAKKGKPSTKHKTVESDRYQKKAAGDGKRAESAAGDTGQAAEATGETGSGQPAEAEGMTDAGKPSETGQEAAHAAEERSEKHVPAQAGRDAEEGETQAGHAAEGHPDDQAPGKGHAGSGQAEQKKEK